MGLLSRLENSLEKHIEGLFKNREGSDSLNGKPHSSGARLRAESGSRRGQFFFLPEAGAVIGRDAKCDLLLEDPRASRIHARIEKSSGIYVIKDLESTNGLYINGVRVQSAELKPGDTIGLGTTLFTFEVE